MNRLILEGVEYFTCIVFHRAQNKYPGTGIGLAVVRKAVQRMGGQVGVISDGRNGSNFWFEVQAVPGASA